MPIALHRRALAGVLLSCFVSVAGAQLAPPVAPLPTTSPESVGLSAERMQRIGAWLKAEVAAGRNPKDAKVMLAKEITARFHSAALADAAEQDFINRSKGGIPDDIPEVRLAGAPLGIGALLKQANLAPSTSEANRLIDGGGVRVDGGVVSDKGLKLEAGSYVVQVGKRKFARVTLA